MPGVAHHQDGHGLGLSIVDAIAIAHHATVTAQAASDGGLSVRVTFLPISSPSSDPTGTNKTTERRNWQ